ncbi:MAG: hypothetical protein ACPGWR_26765 [Ardenticatenaceae bacterium]
MTNQPNNPSPPNSNKTPYIVAAIGLVGTIIAAIITAYVPLASSPVEQVLTVRVADQKGSAVSGASVVLLSNEVPWLNEHTDTNGVALFRIPSATLTNGRLIVETDEYEIHERAIESLTDPRIEVRLSELNPTSSHIIVRVIDPQKNPLSKTELQLFIENNAYNQVADSNGVAKFTVPFFDQQIDALITAKNEGFEVKDQRISLWVNQVQDVLLNPETSEIEVINTSNDQEQGNDSSNTPVAASDTAPSSTDTAATEQEKDIPSDIPGRPLELGSSVKSKIDRDTKPRDVYQVRLKAGEVLEVNLDANEHANIHIFTPNAQSITSNANKYLCWTANCPATFVAAVEGDYYISVSAEALEVVYTLTVRSKEVIPLPNTADEIPGVALDFGSPQKSVIDQDTKPRDVYQVRLKAGEVLEVNLDANEHANIHIFTPNAQFITSNANKYLCWTADCPATFVAAVEGDYYISVSAEALGVVYTLTVRSKEVIPLPKTADEIPGVPLDLGSSITSVIDGETKKRDVYQVKLKAGEVLEVNLDADQGAEIHLFTPNAQFITSGANKFLCSTGYCPATFAAAVEGDYFISVSTQQLGVVYRLAVSSKEVIPLPNTADDIPGVALDFGSPQKSVIDRETKKHDVYKVRLKAGEVLQVNLDANEHAQVHLFTPDAQSITSGASEFLCRTVNCPATFTAEVEGDYHISVSAKALGIVYRLAVNLKE